MTPQTPIRVAVVGASGRMGQEVLKAVGEASDMEVVAAIVRGDDLQAVLADTRPDCLVEFSVPGAVKQNIRIALEAGIVPLVGATGLSPSDLDDVRGWCERAGRGALIAPNFAIGAVLLMRFAAEAARYLPDVEIIEMHHPRKIDAPSGTAIKTAEVIASARTQAGIEGLDVRRAPETYPGARGGRGPGDIPIHSVRLPGFVASQEVIFGGAGQRLSLRHDSIDRASFMPGVLLAIRRAQSLDTLVYGLEHLL